MITKYFTKIFVRFNPFGPEGMFALGARSARSRWTATNALQQKQPGSSCAPFRHGSGPSQRS